MASKLLPLLLAAGALWAEPLRGVLVSPSQLDGALREPGAIVLALSEPAAGSARRVRAAGRALYYWIEIARNPRMADAHPEWMASLQGHPEWRRLFPQASKPADGEVVKNYPWVPVSYREAFEAHLARVAELLRELPPADGIFLNDLQAGPSACGCGNSLCRWTADYGPIRTATPLPADAAARFAAEVGKLAPRSKIIPVWTTECEERDKEKRCAGVGCFAGACWREWTAQLTPLAGQAETLGVLATARALDRDSAWIARALASFAEMPPIRGGKALAAGRLVAVLQGWDAPPDEVRAQIRSAVAAGAGYLVARIPIEQGWEPRVVPVR
ncbi:MAG: hypothetical protein HY013_00855 [Candidatus Solibacter usitatus]|nr:hypothetical protein [Candidatus Solibacter usitatus]